MLLLVILVKKIMNLNAYDIVEEINMGTYVDPCYRCLYSDKIKFKQYYYFFSRFNSKNKCTDYFIYLSDKDVPNSVKHSSSLNKQGLIRIKLSPIWKDNALTSLTEQTKISIELIEEDNDGIMYYLDI